MSNKILAHIYKHWVITKRWPGESATLLVFPFIGLLSMGLFAYFVTSMGGSPDSILFVLVGVIFWNFYEISNRGITYGLTYDIWNDCLKHSFTGGSRSRHFIVGNAIWGLMGAVFTLITVGIVGLLAFGTNIFAAGAFLVANMFFVFLFAVAMGLMINYLMLSKGEKWMSLIWISTGVFMIFSGVYYPVEILPAPMNYISMALAPTHNIISLRAALGLHEAAIILPELLTGAVLSLVYLVLGVVMYRRGVKIGKRNGVITKF